MADFSISDVDAVLRQAEGDFAAVSSNKELVAVRTKYLGKKGIVTMAMKDIANFTSPERKNLGDALNKMKNAIQAMYDRCDLKITANSSFDSYCDVTLPVRSELCGMIHPISYVIEEITTILGSMGFVYADGPDVETEYYNFTALNTPELHPARSMQDSFYLDMPPCVDEGRFMLRTQTSAVQIRHMERHAPPYYIFSIGKVYRRDWDATHTPMFHQIELLCVDRSADFANMKWHVIEFLKTFFNDVNLKFRFRASFFPFTEPSAEVDIAYSATKSGIKIGGDKWLEIMGCGMVHNNVLRDAGVNAADYRGFAWGIGVERLTMLKYGINDLRKFYEYNADRSLNYGFSPFV